MSHNSNTEHSGHHVVPISKYVWLLLGLMGLMGATITAYLIDFTQFFGEVGGTYVNNMIAMAIACLKATLVIMVFMGVKYSSKLVKMYAALGFASVPLLCIGFCDYGFRYMEVEPGWEGHSQLKVTNVIAPTVDPEAVAKAKVAEEGGH